MNNTYEQGQKDALEAISAKITQSMNRHEASYDGMLKVFNDVVTHIYSELATLQQPEETFDIERVLNGASKIIVIQGGR